MQPDRETEILEALPAVAHERGVKLLLELFALRREKHRDKLENNEDATIRGRAKECKDLLNLFG